MIDAVIFASDSVNITCELSDARSTNESKNSETFGTGKVT